MQFVDIHSHIIPGVDDGSASMEASLRLVEIAYAEGIRRMIATPHFGIINQSFDRSIAEHNLDLLRAEVSKLHPDMEFYMGNEIFLMPGYPDGLDDGMSCTLAGSKLALVEFSVDVDFDTMFHELRRIILKGYTPVLAHVERFRNAWKDIKGLELIRNQGVMIQVNSNAVTAEPQGFFKKTNITHELIRRGLVDFVATDCHDMPGREPRMKAAFEKIIEIAGEEEAERLTAGF